MLTLTSNSMDELNSAYKKLKGTFTALDEIKLDTTICQYTLKVEKLQLNPIVRNLLEKIEDLCDEAHDLETVSVLSFNKFINTYDDQYIFLRQLKGLWDSSSPCTKQLIVEHLGQLLDKEVLSEDSIEPVAS